MNLVYEEYPNYIMMDGQKIHINTDFREIIKLFDLLKDTEVKPQEKVCFLSQYFEYMPRDFNKALEKLTEFITMEELKVHTGESKEDKDGPTKKSLYSFKLDYPYIFSAFLRDYNINIRTIPYLHWWEFRMLFDGLAEDNEIKQRIMYRNINLGEIKDENERNRIAKIQRLIQLPDEVITDYDIGDALW